MPRSNKEILNEIESLNGIREITITDEKGQKETKCVNFIEGYITALSWAISTTDDEGEA